MAALAARTFALACPPTTTAEAIAEHVRTVLSPARFRAHLADPAHRVVLAEVGGRPVGYTMVVAAPPADADVAGALRLRPEVELSKVYVERGSHGAGLARPLMAETLRVARELAGERGRDAEAGIWLGVNEHNARAIRFYERSGFRIVGTRSFRLSDAVETDHVMEQGLAATAGH
ncbi:GNAT family N-acetyltransferase [Clavibacter nebraskensis]|uniref:GNAT family N-acetyltransferase n=1 Tax=Clavibacter nebraskensis TaxID=31963 RepID=A0A399QLU2_9MICO|nr:GNAT family N-acetyltransferase [Clavibacter nebraskensis]RIJ18552.1 GNAT family N-acetyltransferase [Clavibacter nebraskensis]UQB13340.1 GNAT family N-acetyltransferase [Clavibacter nebraskensis]UQB16177.1 GNAT family N-acetyltransferase [Clavibacter nebraskensis]